MTEEDESCRGQLKLTTDPQRLENLHLGFLDWMEKRLTDQIEEYLFNLGQDTGVFYMNSKLAEFVGTHIKRDMDFDLRVFNITWNALILMMMKEAREALGIVGERERAIAVRDVSNKMAVTFLEHVRFAAEQKKAELAANPRGEAPELDATRVVLKLVYIIRGALGIRDEENNKAGK